MIMVKVMEWVIVVTIVVDQEEAQKDGAIGFTIMMMELRRIRECTLTKPSVLPLTVAVGFMLLTRPNVA